MTTLSLNVTLWHRRWRWALLPIKHLVIWLKWVERIQNTNRTLYSLLQCTNLSSGNIVRIMEGNRRLDMWWVVDVEGHSPHPTLRRGASNILTKKAELWLSIVPLQLSWFRSSNRPDCVHISCSLVNAIAAIFLSPSVRERSHC